MSARKYDIRFRAYWKTRLWARRAIVDLLRGGFGLNNKKGGSIK
jgi:hypothetical protein